MRLLWITLGLAPLVIPQTIPDYFPKALGKSGIVWDMTKASIPRYKILTKSFLLLPLTTQYLEPD